MRRVTFAVLVFAILAVVGVSILPPGRETSLAGQKCADLVAQQAATTSVVPGAWECLGGGFKAEMVDNGATDAASFAQTGPGTDPPASVRFIGRTNGGAYIYEVGSTLWKFTVLDGKVVSYR